MRSTEQMAVVAVCDVIPENTQKAREELPDIATYNDVAAMLAESPVELCTVIVPHHLHYRVAQQCLRAGRHVVLEKPLTIAVDEADALIDEASKRGLVLTASHNRNWDGDFLAIREVIDQGLLGEIFHVELWGGAFSPPRDGWRRRKELSGGPFYDWGAHQVWWVLQLIPHPVTSVLGIAQKRIWLDSDIEDDVQCLLQFSNGATAHIHESSILSIDRQPRWWIYGTKGTLVASPPDGQTTSARLYQRALPAAGWIDVPYRANDYPALYRSVAAHLLRGEELAIRPEAARRVVAIIEATYRSIDTHQVECVRYEDAEALSHSIAR
jgi:scyllo-inositol 2-dehydrogenase (NADP+)